MARIAVKATAGINRCMKARTEIVADRTKPIRAAKIFGPAFMGFDGNVSTRAINLARADR